MGLTVTAPPKGFSQRKITAASRIAIQAAASYWHQTMLPQHFTTGGAAKYNYAPRTPKYMKRKARKMGHQRPLTYSGQSAYQAKNDFSVTATSIAGHLAGVVSMELPDYFVKHPANSASFIDKPSELTRITPDEEDILAGVFAERLSRELGMGQSLRYG